MDNKMTKPPFLCSTLSLTFPDWRPRGLTSNNVHGRPPNTFYSGYRMRHDSHPNKDVCRLQDETEVEAGTVSAMDFGRKPDEIVISHNQSMNDHFTEVRPEQLTFE